MPIGEQVLVLGLTPRGGAHVLYCGTDEARARALFSKVGPQFVEASLFVQPTPTARRQPQAEAEAAGAARRDSREAELAARRVRVLRYKEQQQIRRALSQEQRQKRREARENNRQGPTPEPASAADIAAASEVSDQETN